MKYRLIYNRESISIEKVGDIANIIMNENGHDDGIIITIKMNF